MVSLSFLFDSTFHGGMVCAMVKGEFHLAEPAHVSRDLAAKSHLRGAGTNCNYTTVSLGVGNDTP